MSLTNKQKLEYFKNKKLTEKVILKDAYQDKHIIYGAKAINAQLPKFLNRPTEDFDIFSNTPKADAIETEKKLDRAYRGNFFHVERAKHPNTWKVKSNITHKTAADYTYPNDNKIPNKNIKGNRYAELNWIKSKIQTNLKNPDNKFRFDKDYEALQRIKIYEKNKEFLYG